MRQLRRRAAKLALMIMISVVEFLIGGGKICAQQKVTLAEAQSRIPTRTLPAFWIGDIAGFLRQSRLLEDGRVTIIARTLSGRPIHLVTYGRKEPAEPMANFNSAIGAREPAAYMDKAARRQPVILFVGPVHGHEVEGLTGLVNFINIMETGRDLRGRDWTELQELGSQCRLLIIPDANPDGIARFAPRTLHGAEEIDLRFWGQGTWHDNTLCGWPQAKRLHPMVGANVGFLGCYFNDAGVNLMHDEFFAPMCSETPAILKVARQEGPDLAVSLHSHEPEPAVLRPAYVPMQVQEDIATLARTLYALLAKRNLPHDTPFSPRAETDRPTAPFNLTSALYHVSGGHSFTFECPHGLKGYCQVTLEQILDIQLTLYEAMLRHEIDKKK